MYEYILLDLDGTLIDPKVGITNAVKHALNHFGIEVENTDSLCNFIGPPLKKSFMDFYNLDEKSAALAIIKYREYFAPKGIYENILYDHVTIMLESLKQEEKTIILATSKPTLYAEEILRYHDIYQYFTSVCGSELDGSRVNKDEIIRFALNQNKITELDKVVMIGDREHDIIGAKKVGISSIGVLYGYGSLEEHKIADADKIVTSIRELSAILLNN